MTPLALSLLRGEMTPLLVPAATLLLSFALLTGANAQERRVPSSLNELRLSYAPVVQRAAPTVVLERNGLGPVHAHQARFGQSQAGRRHQQDHDDADEDPEIAG